MKCTLAVNKAAISRNLISTLNNMCKLSVARHHVVEAAFIGHSVLRKPEA